MKVGIALGSGSGKGWTHIGVIKGLQALGIEVDVVAGCSVGALVGGAYVNGHLDALEQWVTGFTSKDMRSMLDVSFHRGSLLSADKFFHRLETYMGTGNIEALSKPFGTVATDLYLGQEIWFRKGDLMNAVRASCAIPGILAPVRYDERWLIDGAVVNPLPVSLCRALGADVVIGVDLHHRLHAQPPLQPVDLESFQKTQRERTQDRHQQKFYNLLDKGKEQLQSLTNFLHTRPKASFGTSMLGVMTQAIDILEYRYKRARVMGDPPDLRITPEVGHIQPMEFHRAEEAIAAGMAAVRRVEHLIDGALYHQRSSNLQPS